MKNCKEVWKISSLAPDYKVSNYGNVQRATYPDSKDLRALNGTYPGRPCKRHQDKDGYWKVFLVVDGRLRSFFAHRLVADAFIGYCPEGMQVNHKDLDTSNPFVGNLEYVTRSGNARHAMANGVPWGNPKGTTKGFCGIKGEGHPLAKLNVEKVKKIRKLYQQGWTYAALGRQFNVTGVNVSGVVRRETWKHVS